MRVIETKVFTFNELSKTAKERAVEKWYEHETYDFLGDDLCEELKCIDKAGIFEDAKLQYSLSNCQGDGLSFSCNINLENYLKTTKLPNWKKDALVKLIYKIYSIGNIGRYCYCSASDIGIEYNNSDYYEDRYSCLFELSKNILDDIKDRYIKMCNHLEKIGYSIIEHRMNDEEFSELCENNGYEFTEDGKLI